MEEILASIRRIISEDDAPAAAEGEAPAAAEAPAEEAEAPAPAASPPPVAFDEEDEDDDVLDLTEPAPAPVPEPAPVRAEPAPATSLGDLDVFSAPPPREPEAAPVRAAAPTPAYDLDTDEDDGLLSNNSAYQAASAFSALSRNIAMPADARTLEDVVREMLRPMLKDWLDTNLPAIVETAVQAEVERIARRRL